MKKLASVFAGLLFCLTTNAFAEGSVDSALMHANAAVSSGSSDTKAFLAHAAEALDDTLAAAIPAKGLLLSHLDEASKALGDAISHTKAGHGDLGVAAAETAVAHLKAAAATK